MNKNYDFGVLILRLSIGILMLLHGIAKIGNLEGVEGMLTAKGLPAFFAFGVFITEIVAPVLIIVGYRTRFAAAMFILGAIVAILLAHPNEIFKLNKYGGWAIELLGLYIFGALTLFFTGSGKIALSSRHRWD